MSVKRFIPRDGLDGNSKTITNVAAPVNDTDAANKGFSKDASNMTTGTLPAARLPFTPVQQGGGTGQGTNKVYIGWSSTTLNLQVDSTNFGATWPISVSGNAGSADAADAASGSSFFTQSTAAEGQLGCKTNGQSDVYMYNNTNNWGIYSAAGGSAFFYTRTTGKFTFNGNALTATKLASAIAINGYNFDGSGNLSIINSPEVNGVMTANDGSCSSLVRNVNNATGDAGMAMLAFLCQGQYGIKMGLRNDGYFGIGGWSRANWSWYTDPSGNMVAGGNVTAYSDPRLKENLRYITGAVKLLKQLDGVYFKWKTGIPHIEFKAGKEDLGVLADQVKRIFPQIVTESIEIDGQTYDTVAYEKLVPVAIQAIKELDADNETLRLRVNAQEKQISDLAKVVAELKLSVAALKAGE